VTVTQPSQPDLTALRAEHDRLAEEIGTRVSVDHVQKGGVLTFFAVVLVGLTAKLAWDRWGWLPVNKPTPPPGIALWFLLALLLALAVIAFAVREFGRAARLRVVENAKYQRVLELRRILELDT
jgi:hypothetical protein